MSIVKILAFVFLAVYLILGGIADVSNTDMPDWFYTLIGALGIASGVLFLVSIKKFSEE